MRLFLQSVDIFSQSNIFWNSGCIKFAEIVISSLKSSEDIRSYLSDFPLFGCLIALLTLLRIGDLILILL